MHYVLASVRAIYALLFADDGALFAKGPHFALQLCRNVYGFDRVATTCSAANEGFVRQCGATEVIPYSSVDFVQRCPRLRGINKLSTRWLTNKAIDGLSALE